MQKIKNLLQLLAFIPFASFGQNYTSYFTGNRTDIVTAPAGGICLMGGATEDDNAMRWFLRRANGGDVLVLRATGSNGYNNYLYSTLGVAVNSVETIVCNNIAAGNTAYLAQRIQQAEAIWFAGGDQATYVSYWRHTPVDSLLNIALRQRNIVVGGTSAGMAIQGKYYFSARFGTVTSSAALTNPFNNAVTVDSASFIKNNYLSNVITDTHFDNPDRKGRLVAFLARMHTAYGVLGKAIACDEYTAVCIDSNGLAQVFGNYPTRNDNAYFVQTNCELANQAPENCTNGMPLTWNLNGQALRVYELKGTSAGTNTFNLATWQSGTGGTWKSWSATNGTFAETPGNPINCNRLSINTPNCNAGIDVYPNPVEDKLTVSLNQKTFLNPTFKLLTTSGKEVSIRPILNASGRFDIYLSEVGSGIYFFMLVADGTIKYKAKLIKE